MHTYTYIHIYIAYIKMSEDALPKYYQNNKTILQKKLLKGIKSFLKKKNNNATILL